MTDNIPDPHEVYEDYTRKQDAARDGKACRDCKHCYLCVANTSIAFCKKDRKWIDPDDHMCG